MSEAASGWCWSSRNSARQTVTAYYPASDGQESTETVLSGTTTGNKIDFAQELKDENWLPDGTKMSVEVYASDANGVLLDSEAVSSETVGFVRTSYIKVLMSMNVYAGPGRSYERIGGLKKDDYVSCLEIVAGEDGTFCLIDYNGVDGYVDRSLVRWFLERDFNVRLDLQDGRVVEVPVNPDGRLV